MENFETIETIDDFIYDSENFPVKDHSHAARRKKAYFKSKHRFDRVLQKGFTPYRNKESVLQGMMRKTNVIKVYCSSDDTRQHGFNRCAIRRLASANDKLSGYFMEG